MEIKLDEITTVEVEIGSFVYDELTDTWIAWDMIDPMNKTHLKTLVKDIETATTAIRAATINTVTTLMKPTMVS